MDPERPRDGAIEAALERLLRSKPFQNVGRLHRLLRYVVQETVQGRAEGIKEYTIGVAVYNRGIGFDPRLDGIVRVDAINLRKRLEEYYRTEGLDDGVVLSIPKGGYVPTFETRVGVADFDRFSDQDLPEVCWRGHALLLQQRPEVIRQAQRYFWKVVQRWPSRSEGYAGLAESVLCEMGIQGSAPSEGVPVLLMSAARALQLDPGCEDVQIYSAVPGVCGPDPQSSDAALRRVLESNPSNAIAHFWAAGLHSARGENHHTLAHLQSATRLQPQASMFFVWGAAALYYSRQYGAAREQVLAAIEMDPADFMARFWLAMICIELGRNEEATQAATQACRLSSSAVALAGLGYVQARRQQREEAEISLEKLTVLANSQYVARSGFAVILTALGRLREAHAELLEAAKNRESILGWYRWDPRWEPLKKAVPSVG